MHSTILAATTGQWAGALLVAIIGIVVVFAALVRIAVTPRDRWPHGRLSKTAWIIATLWFTLHSGPMILPLGAIAALWKTHRLTQQRKPDPLSVPYAEGTSGSRPNPKATNEIGSAGPPHNRGSRLTGGGLGSHAPERPAHGRGPGR